LVPTELGVTVEEITTKALPVASAVCTALADFTTTVRPSVCSRVRNAPSAEPFYAPHVLALAAQRLTRTVPGYMERGITRRPHA